MDLLLLDLLLLDMLLLDMLLLDMLSNLLVYSHDERSIRSIWSIFWNILDAARHILDPADSSTKTFGPKFLRLFNTENNQKF